MTEILINGIETLKSLGPFIIFLVIIIESMIPLIPVGVFMTLNFVILGPFLGFITSWMATIIGCSLAFFICRRGFSKYFYQRVRRHPQFKRLINRISRLKLSHMVIYLAVPFTPAFMFNLGCGLTAVSYWRFLIACLIGKISLVYFWGYIGISLLESLTNPVVLCEIVGLVLLAYLVSLLIQKIFI